MKVTTFMLADSAQSANNKLYILGGGWSSVGEGPILMGLALKIDVPWNQANQRHRAVMELRHGDGEAVVMAMPEGRTLPVQISADFEVGRPAGLTPGTDLDAVLAVNIGPLPLPAGRFEWRLSINGTTEDDWVLPFSVRPERDQAN